MSSCIILAIYCQGQYVRVHIDVGWQTYDQQLALNCRMLCLVSWPEESSYSVVAESKTVNAKECSAGQTVQVKEGSKCFSGTVVAVGSKVDIEKQLSEMEGNKEQGT